MRKNVFNETILDDPEDDPTAAWAEAHGDDPQLYARFIEEDQGLWGCELYDADSEDTMSVDNFPSEDHLREWLARHRITPE